QGSDYFHYDGLGSTINLTDEKGSVTMTYAYDAFGAVTKEEDGVGWKRNDYKFVGKYGVHDDPAAGLQYMLNRWYDPAIGRFITKDPIWNQPPFPLPTHPAALDNPQILHSYVYSLNNPINYIDPEGLFCIKTGSTRYTKFIKGKEEQYTDWEWELIIHQWKGGAYMGAGEAICRYRKVIITVRKGKFQNYRRDTYRCFFERDECDRFRITYTYSTDTPTGPIYPYTTREKKYTGDVINRPARGILEPPWWTCPPTP
ncbi:MAG: RHS repeat-associated core domain-containing protein, partial [bacterium]